VIEEVCSNKNNTHEHCQTTGNVKQVQEELQIVKLEFLEGELVSLFNAIS
jgi:hypothetical protein